MALDCYKIDTRTISTTLEENVFFTDSINNIPNNFEYTITWTSFKKIKTRHEKKYTKIHKLLPVHHLVKQITGNFLFRKFYCENLTRGDFEDAEVPVVCGDEGELGGEPLVYEVGIEDVELVSLHNLRRRVVEVVVGLVVLVPLEPSVNTIEIPGKNVSQ